MVTLVAPSAAAPVDAAGRRGVRHVRACRAAALAVVGLLGATVALVGCRASAGAGATAAPATSAGPAPAVSSARALAFPSPPRAFALPRSGEEPALRDRDGTERYLIQGLRLTRRPDGALARARDLIPAPAVVVTELPERVGRGYLFLARTSGESLLWRARSWTGPLQPLARLGFDAESVQVGFDRLYVVARDTREVVALDPSTGAVVDLGSLPRTAAVRSLAFADAWFGIVDLPYRGALVTFDAGASWHPLGLGTVRGLTAGEGEIVAQVEADAITIDSRGRVVRRARLDQMETASPGLAAEPPRRARPPAPLREAVLRGWPDPPDHALVITAGTLARVRLRDGAVVARAKDVVDRGDQCQAVPLGEGFGFVCTREQGGTTLLRFRPPLGVERALAFATPRYVAPGGQGALAIRGGCADDPSRPASGLYCIVGVDGDVREIGVSGDRGVERVVALGDGRVAVLVPPRFGAPGQLTLVDRAGRSEAAALALPAARDARRGLLRRALWLDGFRERGPGELAGWVADADEFVGVRVAFDGHVTVGKPSADLGRSVLAGPFALTRGREGTLRETTDGGFTWRESDSRLDVEALAGSGRREQGCSALGCAIGSWVRVGWQGRKGKPDALAVAERPRGAVFPPTEGGRWLMRCALDRARGGGAVAPPAGGGAVPRRRTPPRAAPTSAGLTAENVESTAWEPFFGSPAPALKPAEVGFDAEAAGLAGRLHVYAAGPRGADWTRAATWRARGYDAFDVTGQVWSTVPAPTPWVDVVAAAQAFGLNVYGNPSPDLTVTLEPGGRAGVLSMAAAGSRQLFVAEAGRAFQPIRDAAAQDVAAVAGAVKVGGRFYIGIDRGSFRIYRVTSDRLALVGDYPEVESSSSAASAVVVRSARGDALGIWVRAARVRGAYTTWYVFPIDPETGAVEPPLVIEPRELGRVPPACSVDDEGWLLVGAPPVAPYVEIEGQEGAWSPRRVDARWIAGPQGLCLDALSAEGEPPTLGDPTPATGAPPRRTVTMTVLDADRPFGRAFLRCSG